MTPLSSFVFSATLFVFTFMWLGPFLATWIVVSNAYGVWRVVWEWDLVDPVRAVFMAAYVSVSFTTKSRQSMWGKRDSNPLLGPSAEVRKQARRSRVFFGVYCSRIRSVVSWLKSPVG